MMTEQYYRVWNRCKHTIGVQLLNGRSLAIKPNSFQLLSMADIQYIESICRTVRYFSSKMLVPTETLLISMSLAFLCTRVTQCT